MMNWRNAEAGTYANQLTYCPVNCHGQHDCPYSDSSGICHIDNPQAECDDWAAFFASWEDWLDLDKDDIPDDVDETGYNPFAGGYDYDC
jgi:hypothetical protein